MHKIDFKYAEMQLKLDSKRRYMANLAKKLVVFIYAFAFSRTPYGIIQANFNMNNKYCKPREDKLWQMGNLES